MNYKYKQLPELSGYYSQMVWDLSKHDFYIEELKNIKTGDGSKIFFEKLLNPTIIKELKVYSEKILNDKKISWAYALALSRGVRHIIEYLNRKPEITSILDIPKTTILEEYPVFLKKNGIKPYMKVRYRPTNEGYKKERNRNKISEFSHILRFHNFIYQYNYINDSPLMDKDIWHLDSLGFKVEGFSPHCPRYTISFTRIKQPKIKLVMKKYILERLLHKVSVSTVLSDIRAFIIFSDFLAKYYPNIDNLSLLTRDIIEDFFQFLTKLDMAEISKDKHKGKIRLFLYDITTKGWADSPICLLISKREILSRHVKKPQIFSEEEVLILKKYMTLRQNTENSGII